MPFYQRSLSSGFATSLCEFVYNKIIFTYLLYSVCQYINSPNSRAFQLVAEGVVDPESCEFSGARRDALPPKLSCLTSSPTRSSSTVWPSRTLPFGRQCSRRSASPPWPAAVWTCSREYIVNNSIWLVFSFVFLRILIQKLSIYFSFPWKKYFLVLFLRISKINYLFFFFLEIFHVLCTI